MPRRQIALLALLPAFCAPGCCSLARLFCGADDSEWVQISRRTPEEALATFQEAARRDNCVEIYNGLSEGLKRSWGAALAEVCKYWETLKDDYPVHMLGYGEATELQKTREVAEYELDVEGYKFRFRLVRVELWEVHTDLENAPIISRYRPWEQMVRYGDGNDGTLVVIVPDPVEVAGLFDLDPESIREVRVTREWRVDAFQPVEDSQ